MSVFTNPAALAVGQAAAYITAVLDLLGDQDPLEVLRQTPRALARTLDAVSGEQARQPEAAGKWSVRDLLQHLADSELVYGYRLRLVLTQDRPRLVGFDQDEWARCLHYERAEPEAALELFRVLRRANLALVEGASAGDLQRVGIHAERGGQTIEQMIPLWAGHDLIHLNQIERICKAVT